VGDNADFLRRAFKALNEGDPEVFLDAYAEEIELYVPAQPFAEPEAGLYRGHDAVNRWYAQNYAAWGGSMKFEIDRIEDIGHLAVVHGRGRGTGKRSGLGYATSFVVVFAFEAGRIVSIAQYVTSSRTVLPEAET
jgi:ketosteroid isomerase-like protein